MLQGYFFRSPTTAEIDYAPVKTLNHNELRSTRSRASNSTCNCIDAGSPEVASCTSTFVRGILDYNRGYRNLPRSVITTQL